MQLILLQCAMKDKSPLKSIYTNIFSIIKYVYKLKIICTFVYSAKNNLFLTAQRSLRRGSSPGILYWSQCAL